MRIIFSILPTGVLDFLLAEHVLNQVTKTHSEADRIPLEHLKIQLGLNSDGPGLSPKDHIPSLIADTHLRGEILPADRH